MIKLRCTAFVFQYLPATLAACGLERCCCNVLRSGDFEAVNFAVCRSKLASASQLETDYTTSLSERSQVMKQVAALAARLCR